MELGFTTAAYVVAAVLFILSLGGLSGQESAKRAVWYGIFGMALAVYLTLIGPVLAYGPCLFFLLQPVVLLGIFCSGVEMTQMPELVAGMHALVSLAAVFVGFNADLEIKNVASAVNSEAVKELTGFAALVAKKSGVKINILRVELFLGVFIGAITFTGSIIAYGKLSGRVTSAAVKLPGGHFLNASAAIISVLCLIWYLQTGGILPLLLMTILAFWFSFDHGNWWSRHASGCVYVEQLFWLGCSRHWFSLGNDLLIVVGALVGSSGAILSYIMCKAMNRSFISVILGGFGGASGPAMEVEGEQIAIDADGVASALDDADSVIIIPGYGLAVAKPNKLYLSLLNVFGAKGRM